MLKHEFLSQMQEISDQIHLHIVDTNWLRISLSTQEENTSNQVTLLGVVNLDFPYRIDTTYCFDRHIFEKYQSIILSIYKLIIKYADTRLDISYKNQKTKKNQEIKFEKISYQQFKKDMLKYAIVPKENPSQEEIKFNEEYIKKAYNNIKLPQRQTHSSAGYDFFIPYDKTINHNKENIICSGIKVKMPSDIMLSLYPRSSYGFKYGMKLKNTVGIVDADYYNNEDNDGHIMFNIQISYQKEISLTTHDRYAQGIFISYHPTSDDYLTSKIHRQGGIGSTNNK